MDAALENLLTNLTCPACEDTFRECVVLPCLHRFCAACVGTFDGRCRECRLPFGARDATRCALTCNVATKLAAALEPALRALTSRAPPPEPRTRGALPVVPCTDDRRERPKGRRET